MLKESSLVNRCYILRQKLTGDTFCDWWRASAIFAASDFLLRVMRREYREETPIGDPFPVDAWRSYDVVAPSVLPLIEIDRIEDTHFVVSEYSGYKTLRSELEGGLAVSIEHAFRLVVELAEAIDSFHQKKIPYGVVSPDSVVVLKSGNRIEELKLSKPSYLTLFPKIPDDRLDDIRETWGYAAPEIKKGEPANFSSDLYSLAIVLYRLLAGKIPYGSRSGLRVKQRSAAPSHVASSLARRGIPREIAVIIVRSLRKNPASRYGDALSFIADLRAFLDARREASIKSGKVDPIADLAALNLRKARAGAREITRSLDTVDYFRILSEAAVSAPERQEIIEMIRTFQMTEEIEELEELEAEEAEDDDARDVYSYVEEGYAKIAPARRATPAAPIPKRKPEPPPARPTEPVSGILAVPSHDSIPIPEKPKASPEFDPRRTPPAAKAERAPRVEAPLPLDTEPPRAELPVPAGIKWRRSGGTPGEIVQELTVSFKRAFKERGSFRFIEDPGTGQSADLIRGAIESFKTRALVVDLGILPKGDFATEAGEAVLYELRERVEREPEGRRRYLRRKLSELGEWDHSAGYLIRYVKTIARKGCPLILIGKDAESIDKTLHPFFTELADIAGHTALCAFFFYRSEEVESWHALSALSGRTGPATDGSRS